MSVCAGEVVRRGAGGGGGPPAAPPALRPPANAPNNPPQPPPHHSKNNCCLCWCCCCSCSCLAVKSAEDNGPTKKEPSPGDALLCDGEPPPTLEEIQGWGKSFDKLMRSAAGRKVFRDFLRCEYSEENIMFWLACEELKRERNPDAVEEKARFIYEDYISILSPKEVSLDSRVREIVNRNMVEPTPHTFDEAQLQIYTLMHRDSYPRFVNSPLYKALAQVTSGSLKQTDSTEDSEKSDENAEKGDADDIDPTAEPPKCTASILKNIENGSGDSSNDSKLGNDNKVGTRASPMRPLIDNDNVPANTTIIAQHTGEATA